MKIDSSNVMRVLWWGLLVYWLVAGLSLATIFTNGGEKSTALALGIMSLIASSWCAGASMLVLSSYAFTAIREKWKGKGKGKRKDRLVAGAWTGWMFLPLPGILWVTWMVLCKFVEP
ncbi:MAG: hypothetical protein JWO82_33 [Akkermansiaceae bacterium]|nr:hypothetical protein [Akkermansiaceae bacterium]